VILTKLHRLVPPLQDGQPRLFWDGRRAPFYARMIFDGSWLAFRHAHVDMVARGPAFTNHLFGNPDAPTGWEPVVSALWLADGKRHRDLVRAVGDGLHEDMVGKLSEFITQTAHSLVDRLARGKDRTFDLMTDFAWPLSFAVTCRIMGMAPDELPEFDLHLRKIAEMKKFGVPVDAGWAPMLARLRQQRRVDRRTGLVSRLIGLQEAGYVVGDRVITDRDIDGVQHAYFAAGTDTSAVGLAGEFVLFDRWRVTDLVRENLADREFLYWTIEETLRLMPPFPVIRVKARRDTELAPGVHVAQGQHVTAFLTAANRDPDVFAQPERFIIDRRPRQHLAFAAGAHYCPGAHLTRLEQLLATQVLLTRLPGLRVVGQPVRRRGVVNRIVELPMAYDRMVT